MRAIEIDARLLRDDEHDRIRLFGEADRGAMARAEMALGQHVLGERQETAGGFDLVSAHDRRAVVQR